MKKVFHKIMSAVMAFVVLFSTISFTIDMHYCGNTLVDAAIFQQAKSCGMDMQSPSTKECSITTKNCCKDEQLVVDGQDELQFNVDNISFEQQFFIASFLYTYVNLFEEVEENNTSYKDYSPPPVIRQIYKLDETYLI